MVVSVANRTEDTEALYVEIPPSLKYLIDEDDRTNKEIAISAFERELGVSSADSVAVMERKIRRKERRLEEELETARESRDRVERLKDDLDELREIRDNKVDSDGGYRDQLDDVLDRLETGDLNCVYSSAPQVDEIRGEFDRPNEEIHYDLKVRAAEQGRDLYNTHFVKWERAERMRTNGKERPIADVVDRTPDGGDEA